jgi:hypothetical protein
MKKLTYFLTAAAAIIFASCETVVDLDLPEQKPALVVNALTSPDSSFKVTVSHSISVLDNGTISRITNATVELYKDGSFVETLTHSGDGVYISPGGLLPLPGHEYMLKVSAPNYDAVSSTTPIPSAVQIVSAEIRDSVGQAFGYYTSEISLSFNDPAGRGNYYLAEMGIIDSAGYYNPFFIYPTTDESSSKESIGYGIIMSDDLFDGKSYTLDAAFDSYLLTYWDSIPNSKVITTLKSISKDYYLYVKTKNLHYQSQGNPFAEPVQVHTNVEGGFGIFAGYSADTLRVR